MLDIPEQILIGIGTDNIVDKTSIGHIGQAVLSRVGNHVADQAVEVDDNNIEIWPSLAQFCYCLFKFDIKDVGKLPERSGTDSVAIHQGNVAEVWQIGEDNIAGTIGIEF